MPLMKMIKYGKTVLKSILKIQTKAQVQTASQLNSTKNFEKS